MPGRLKKLKAMLDEDINTDDIPDLDIAFWESARCAISSKDKERLSVSSVRSWEYCPSLGLHLVFKSHLVRYQIDCWPMHDVYPSVL